MSAGDREGVAPREVVRRLVCAKVASQRLVAEVRIKAPIDLHNIESPDPCLNSVKIRLHRIMAGRQPTRSAFTSAPTRRAEEMGSRVALRLVGISSIPTKAVVGLTRHA